MKQILSFQKVVFGILTLCLFFVPIIESASIPNGIIASKAHYFNLISIVFIFYNLILLSSKERMFYINSFDILLLFYLCIIILFTVLNESAFYYNETIASKIFAIIDVIILKQFLCADKKIARLFIPIILLTGIYEGLYGQLQLLGILRSNNGNFTLTGSFHNPGPYSIYLGVIFVLSCVALINTDSKSDLLDKVTYFLAWASLILSGIIIPSAQSRTTWIAIVLGLSVSAYMKYKDIIRYKLSSINRSMKIGLAAILFIVCAYTINWLFHYKVESSEGRLLVWKIALNSFKSNPAFGIGFDQFRYQYGNLQSNYINSSLGNLLDVEDYDYVGYVFNDYLQILIENGFLGFLIFLGLLILTFVWSYRELNKFEESRIKKSMLCSLVVILVSACFSYPFEMIPLWFLLLIFLITLTFDIGNFSFQNKLHGFKYIALSICVVLISFIGYKEYNLINGKISWFKGDRYLEMQDYKNAITNYEVAIRHVSEPEVLLVYAKALYMDKDYKKSIEIFNEASKKTADPFLFMNLGNAHLMVGNFNDSEHAYRKSILISPNKMYPRYLLANMFIQKGDSIRAQRVANYIIQMPVPVPSPAIKSMQQEMKTFLDAYKN